ncbi:MAG: hypothetical protein E7191_06955 [Erysipelotrichaceae bacterium]|nr:hypothetical protein [Erysipelotrichaceae bacterium]
MYYKILLLFVLCGCVSVPYGTQEIIESEQQVTRITYPVTDSTLINDQIIEIVQACRNSFSLNSQERQFSYQQYIEEDTVSFLFTCYEYGLTSHSTYTALTYHAKTYEEYGIQELGEYSQIPIEEDHDFYLDEDTIYVPDGDSIQTYPRNKILSIPMIQVDGRNEEESEKSKPKVALTFDDGPNARYTPKILEILEEYDVEATFFVIGQQIKSHENVIMDMIEAGHQIGIHTFTHRDLTKLSDQEILQEISSTKEVLKEMGYTATIVRPPYGSYNEHIVKLIKEPLVLWTIDTRDWESKDSKKIVSLVKNTVKNGDIILFHDMYASTVEAVEILVPYLLDQGYDLVTVEELISNCKLSCVKE